jgi:tripartite-type tricarboxylate transporter receptor subunit TctC
MKNVKCAVLTLSSFLLLCLIVPFSGPLCHAASDYPNKTITLVVPLPPGGLADIGARVLAEAMEKQLKQPVVVVNKPGGAMTVGGYAVASAKPDGYTLGFFVNTAAVPEVYTYFYSAPYSSSDLKPICHVHSFHTGITVKWDAPWNSLKDLVEYARKNPGVKFSHNGKGGLQYVMMISIARAEKIQLVDVPYDGDAAQVPAILGGHVPVGTPAFSVVKPHMDAKKLKVLALSSQKKVDIAPDIPVLGELGYKLPVYSFFLALFAPKNTPDDVVRKINDVVRKLSEDKEFQAKNRSAGLVLDYEDTATFEKYLVQYKSNLLAFFKEEGWVK